MIIGKDQGDVACTSLLVQHGNRNCCVNTPRQKVQFASFSALQLKKNSDKMPKNQSRRTPCTPSVPK